MKISRSPSRSPSTEALALALLLAFVHAGNAAAQSLSNTGSRGALFDTPIINQPQVGILGTGAVVRRPVVLQGDRLGETIAIRSMSYFALTYDHRLIDGADAARFLTDVRARLEQAQFGL